MVNVSDRLSLDMMRRALKIKEETFLDNIFKWAAEFGFRIDGEYLVINKDTVEEFIDVLDKQFTQWENSEIHKNGKI